LRERDAEKSSAWTYRFGMVFERVQFRCRSLPGVVGWSVVKSQLV